MEWETALGDLGQMVVLCERPTRDLPRPGGTRPPLPRRIRSFVEERDGGRCRKCKGGPPGLHVHHIMAVVEGGKNHPRNLALLCGGCHGEWHHVVEYAVETMPGFTFESWLDLPAALFLVLSMTTRWPSDRSAAEYQREIEAVWRYYRERT